MFHTGYRSVMDIVRRFPENCEKPSFFELEIFGPTFSRIYLETIGTVSYTSVLCVF